jgi:membrane-associated phospholipid phosphatase
MPGKHRQLISDYLIPMEFLFGTYLIITGFFILFNIPRLENTGGMILIRALYLMVSIILVVINRRNTGVQIIRNLRIFLPFLLLGYIYKETDALNNIIFPDYFDPFFSRIEERLTGGQPSIIFARAIPFDWFAELMYFGYFSFYFIVAGVPAYLFFKVSRTTGEWFATLIITSFIVYYIIFIILPVEGPQFYFRDFHDPLPEGFIFGPLLRMVQRAGEGRTGAFPISHISICLIAVWGCFRYARGLLKYVLPVSIILIISTVYIRAHYLIDVVAGILVTPLIFGLSKWIYSKVARFIQSNSNDIRPGI